MRNIVIGFLIIMLVFPVINAQENLSQDPGITPDSFLWGIDKSLDQISLLLATSPEAKATKGLEIARERLLEVKTMAQENKLDAVAKAEEAHNKVLVRVRENVQSIEEENPELEIEKEIKIEKRLRVHEEEIEKISAELKIKIKIEGTLTEEQQLKLEEFLSSLGNDVDNVKLEIKNKKGKTKIKIKAKTGKTDEEIEREFEEERKIKAEIINNQTKVKIEKEFSSDLTDRDQISEEIINRFALTREDVDNILEIKTEEAEEFGKEKLKVKVELEDEETEIEVKLRFILNTTDSEIIINEIISRSQLTSEQIDEVLEFKAEELEETDEAEEVEIEVEIEEGQAKVKMKFAGRKSEFVLETTDQEEILREIASRLDVGVDDVRGLVEFEIEDKEEEDSEEGEEESEEENNETEDEDDEEEENEED